MKKYKLARMFIGLSSFVATPVLTACGDKTPKLSEQTIEAIKLSIDRVAERVDAKLLDNLFIVDNEWEKFEQKFQTKNSQKMLDALNELYGFGTSNKANGIYLSSKYILNPSSEISKSDDDSYVIQLRFDYISEHDQINKLDVHTVINKRIYVVDTQQYLLPVNDFLSDYIDLYIPSDKKLTLSFENISKSLNKKMPLLDFLLLIREATGSTLSNQLPEKNFFADVTISLASQPTSFPFNTELVIKVENSGNFKEVKYDVLLHKTELSMYAQPYVDALDDNQVVEISFDTWKPLYTTFNAANKSQALVNAVFTYYRKPPLPNWTYIRDDYYFKPLTNYVGFPFKNNSLMQFGFVYKNETVPINKGINVSFSDQQYVSEYVSKWLTNRKVDQNNDRPASVSLTTLNQFLKAMQANVVGDSDVDFENFYHLYRPGTTLSRFVNNSNYKIEFVDENDLRPQFLDNTNQVIQYSSTSQYPAAGTKIPYKVTNITTGNAIRSSLTITK